MVRLQLLSALPLLALLATGLPAEAADPAGLRALAMGDCAGALAAIPSPEEDALRLALARCEARAGDTSRALSLLEQVQDPGLSLYARLVRGEALVAAGRFEEATTALAGPEGTGLALPGAAAQRAALLRGRALVERGRWEEARLTLNGLLAGELGAAGTTPGPGGADPGEARWWLAQGAIRRGEPDKAVPVMQALWAKNPSSPWAGPAEAWLAAQGRPVTDLADEGTRALVRSRADTLAGQRLYPQALALEDSLGGPSSLNEEARLAFRAKDYPRAVAAFARMPNPTPAQRFDHALATSRTGDYAGADKLYRALIAAAPTSSQADEASFKLGYLAYDAGRLDEAQALFTQHLERYPSSAHGSDARWFRAWSLVKLGRDEPAAAALEDFLSRHGKSEVAPNAAWWRAWLRAKAGDRAGAQAGWRDVVARWPTTSAAWFASQELGLRLAGVPTSGPPPEAPAALQTPAWHRGRALARAGLEEWARAELLPLVEPAKAQGQAARVALALALVEAGAYRQAQELARPWCGAAWKAPGDPWALRACTPRPHEDVVSAIATEAGLDPLLPYAIMNAESALDPAVTSLAGARGLMQLMPELAASHHRARFGPTSPYQADDLYQPGYNAALGTTELASLWGRFRGAGVEPALPLVIAGYNGGPEAVQRWLGAWDSPPTGARFAEDVGYTETRRYVRRVLGYLQQYRYVYGDG